MNKIADEVANLVGMTPNEYATEIMNMANKHGLDVANKVNHEAFYKKLVDYEHFHKAAELLTTIILSR